MRKTKKERIIESDRLLAMRPEVEKELLRIPGVRRVGVGLKVTNRLATEGLCFRVYVDHKKPLTELPVEQIIPDLIGNIKTDVNQVPRFVKASGKSDNGKYRPLWGGTRIMSSKSPEIGTLGCLAIDNENEKLVLLSCYHILMGHGEQKGHQVAQPDFCCDRCPCRCGEIAKVERGAWAEKNVDAAIAILSDDFIEKWVNEVIDLGPVTPVPLDAQGKPKTPIVAGDIVFKRGVDTRVTEGLIVEAETDIDVVYNNTPTGTEVKTFTKQLLIKPKIFHPHFSETGDCGAVVINELNEIIGLLYSDNTGGDSFEVDGPQSYANPIQDVMKALDITIPSTGTLEAMPLRSNGATRIPKMDILDKLEKTIEQYENGSVLIDAFKKHREEVMQLISNDREVKVAWNRFQGPSFISHLLEKINNPDYTVPASIESVSYQLLLSKMSVVLEKKGSREIAADIENYSTKAFLLISELIHSFNGK